MRRPSAKTFRLVAMTAASAAVAACGLSSASNNTNALLAGPTGQPITVGISLPLSGPQAAGGFAPDGQATKRGYELWASDVNSHGGLLGRPVKLIILNDEGVPKTDANNYRIADHPGPCRPDARAVLVPARLSGGGRGDRALRVCARGRLGRRASGLRAEGPRPVLHQRAGHGPDDPVRQVAGQTARAPDHRCLPRWSDDPFADPPVQNAQMYLAKMGYRRSTPRSTHATPAARGAGCRGRQAVAQTHPQVVFLGSVAVATVQAFMTEFASCQSPLSTSSPPPARTRAQASSTRSGPAPPWARWSRTDGPAPTRTRSAT